MTEIERVFSGIFEDWDIQLPVSAVNDRAPGTLYKGGWTIEWVFGEDEQGIYLDYYASHGMTNDRHVRLRESGKSEWLPSRPDWILYPPDTDDADRERIEAEWNERYGRLSQEIADKFKESQDHLFYGEDCPEEFLESLESLGAATITPLETVNDATAIIALNVANSDGKLEPPPEANTGTPYITRVLEKHARDIIYGDGVAVPHDEEEMNWRLFFAHSQDMQGFRADIFTGGPNENDNPHDPQYRGLRDRWPDSKSMIEGLADLWEAPEAREILVSLTAKSAAGGDRSIAPAMDLLRGEHGNEATRVFADALEDLSGPKIGRKTRRMIRAYVQNSALLLQYDASFQWYLRSVAPDIVLPSQDLIPAERAWRRAIERDFYNVGPALANYMICDWLLWLWQQGQIEWFESYKADSVFLKALADQGKLPAAAVDDFPTYCRTLQIPPVWIPREHWTTAYYNLPPRVLNEAIWLEEAATAPKETAPAKTASEEAAVKVDIERVEWPERFHHLWDVNVDPADTPPGEYEGVCVFVDDDEGYVQWLGQHPQGYVVNAHRQPRPEYIILHRSTCWCISREWKNEEQWTSVYIKVCAEDRETLARWARDEVGGDLHPCGICLR